MGLKLFVRQNGAEYNASVPTMLTKYDGEFKLVLTGPSSYLWSNLRVRSFWYHHFSLPTNSEVGGFFNTHDTSLDWSSNAIDVTNKYQNWKNDIYPPKIDTDKFCSEVSFYFKSPNQNDSINPLKPIADGGIFTMQGVYGFEKYNNYYDIENSYSYINTPGFIENPMNYLLEEKVWTKAVSQLALTNNTLTVKTSTNHNLNLGDGICLNVSFVAQDYNSNFRVSSIVDSSTFTVEIKAYTEIPDTYTAVVEYWTVLNGRAPSSAVSYNYNNTVYANPLPSLHNHIKYTWLIYANKDTGISLTNGIPDEIGYATSSVIPIQNCNNGLTSIKKGVFRFPVNNYNIPLSIAPFYAEMNIQNYSMYTGNTIYQLFQMSSDEWNVNSTWGGINPYIESTIIATQNTNSTFSNQSLNCYMKFDVSGSVGAWLNGVDVPDVSMVKFQNTDLHDSYWITSSADKRPSVEEWPFVVISGSSVPVDTLPPTVKLMNTSTSIGVSNILGDGFGMITVQCAVPHNLNNLDVVQITNTLNYNDSSCVVTVINANNFSYTQIGNVAIVSESNGTVYRSDVVTVRAMVTDDVLVSINPTSLEVKKTADMISVSPTSILPISPTTAEFTFTLSNLVDGYYQVQVKDAAGNLSAVIAPPIITQYLKMDSLGDYSTFPDMFRRGDVLYFRGFNVASYNNSFRVIMGAMYENGLVYGGINSSINQINTQLNQFSNIIPVGLSNEWDIGLIDYALNTIEILYSNISVDMAVVFNVKGNGIQPLEVGRIYYVKTAVYNNTSTIITLSESIGGTTVNLINSSVDIGLVKMYNKYFTAHVEKDGVSSASYSNVLLIPIDDYAPFIALPYISSPGEIVTITISDPSGVNMNTLSMTNAEMHGTPVDVYGDGTVIELDIKSTSDGDLSITCADFVGNYASLSQFVVSPTGSTIAVTNCNVVSVNEFKLTVKVFNKNVPPIIADNNSSYGIYVESAVNNIPFGIITSINSVSDGVVFTMTVNNIGVGFMRIYANDFDDNSSSIVPPIITNVYPLCGQTGDKITVKGVNLGSSPESNDMYQIITSTVNNTGFNGVIINTTEGYHMVNVVEVITGRTFISNSLQFRIDNTPPIISINGPQIFSVNQFSGPYIDLGATATDNFKDLSSKIITIGASSVNTSVIGNYTVSYSVTDECGLSNMISRTVRVVSGCELDIQAAPNTGRVGDLIAITATKGTFNSDYTRNVVTFNGVIAEIISGNSTLLNVVIPNGSASGVITVETFESCGLANTDPSNEFVVIYDDVDFNNLKVAYTIEKRKSTTAETFSVFQPTKMTSPIYNIDYSYSYFTPIVDENSMVQNVITIIMTGIGERIFNPKFGTTIKRRLFNLVSSPNTIEAEILSEIKTAVAKYEPRVSILIPQSFILWDESNNDLRLVLAISMPSGSVKKVGLSLKNQNGGASL